MNNFTKCILGRHWYEAFLKRNPSIVCRVPQNLIKSRATIDEEEIKKWFTEVKKYMENNNYCKDSIVNSVISKFINRSDVGIKKYGVTLDRDDLDINEWINHAQEEHMDAILYLEKLKQQYQECKCQCKCQCKC